MIPRQPMALRPLALLTLAVVGVHVLLLCSPFMRESPRPAAMKTLVTRVLDLPRAPAPGPVGSEIAQATPRVLPIQRPSGPATAPRAAAASAAPIGSPPASAPTPPPAAAMALAIPGSVRLLYAVTGQARGRAFAGEGRLSWRHDGGAYEARLDVPTAQLPSRSQTSSGRITAEGLTPRRFADKVRGEQAAHFERDKGTLVFSSNAPQQPLVAGAQDRLSVYLQLAAMLAAQPGRFPAGTGITVHTVGSRDAQAWLFTVEADEALDLPGGRVPTRKLVRLPRGEYDLRIELWLGTSMDYVPVRLRLTQANGDFVDQQWASTDRP